MEPQQNDSSSDRPDAPTTPPAAPAPVDSSGSGSGGKNKMLIGVIIAAVILLAVGAVLLMSNKSDDNKNNSSKNGTSQNKKSDNVYVSQKGGFSFTKPTGWEEGDTPNFGENAAAVLYWPPGSTQESLSAIVVAAYPKPEGQTLSQMVEESKGFAKDFPDFTIVDSKEFQHKGNNAIYTEVTYTLQGKAVHQSLLAVEKGDKFYTVTVTLPEAEWAANQERAQTVQDSLEIE